MPLFDAGEVITPIYQRPEFATEAGRVALLREVFPVLRPEGITGDEADYYDFISGALDEAHASMSLEDLEDPTKLKVVTCLDRNAAVQQGVVSQEIAEALNDPANMKPGGLYYLWRTRLIRPWAAYRIFNDFLISTLHKNCGGVLVSAGHDQLNAQTLRAQAIVEFYREINRQSSIVRGVWLATRGLSAAQRRRVQDFHGPRVMGVLESSSGTAANFMKLREPELDTLDIHSHRTLSRELDRWLAEGPDNGNGVNSSNGH